MQKPSMWDALDRFWTIISHDHVLQFGFDFGLRFSEKKCLIFFGKIHLEGFYPSRWSAGTPPGGIKSPQVDFFNFF